MLHRRVGDDAGLESVELLLALAVQADLDQRGQAMTQHGGQPVGLQQRDLALDHPQLDQAPHPAQAGRGRNTQALGQGLIRARSIALQFGQQPEVELIKNRFFHCMDSIKRILHLRKDKK
ncbi:MAG: hypothetical protein RIS48_2573 [Pseudomonadota bacterium]